MKDRFLFFDLDDTLYERSDPFIRAFSELFPEYASIAEEAYHAFTRRGDEVFLPSQRGEITMEEMNLYRYRKGLEDVGVFLDKAQVPELQALYQRNQRNIHLSEGIPEILTFCREHFRGIGIITNGPAGHQRDKITDLGIGSFFDPNFVLISGELGVDKPDPAIFCLAQSRTGADTSHLIYIGDSYKNDMRPAVQLGWGTIWLNKTGSELKGSDPVPDLILRGKERLRTEHLLRLCENPE